MADPPNDRAREADRTADRRDAERREAEDASAWFAMSTLRVLLVIIGFVVVLFALGQAVGVDLLGMFAEALQTQVGRWLVVAFFGLLLIAVALRGFGRRYDYW